MTGDRARRLAQLRDAFESGILDEDTYRAAVEALGAEPEVRARLEGGGASLKRIASPPAIRNPELVRDV